MTAKSWTQTHTQVMSKRHVSSLIMATHAYTWHTVIFYRYNFFLSFFPLNDTVLTMTCTSSTSLAATQDATPPSQATSLSSIPVATQDTTCSPHYKYLHICKCQCATQMLSDNTELMSYEGYDSEDSTLSMSWYFMIL